MEPVCCGRKIKTSVEFPPWDNENGYPIETQCQDPDPEEIQLFSDRVRTSCNAIHFILLLPYLLQLHEPLEYVTLCLSRIMGTRFAHSKAKGILGKTLGIRIKILGVRR